MSQILLDKYLHRGNVLKVKMIRFIKLNFRICVKLITIYSDFDIRICKIVLCVFRLLCFCVWIGTCICEYSKSTDKSLYTFKFLVYAVDCIVHICKPEIYLSVSRRPEELTKPVVYLQIT